MNSSDSILYEDEEGDDFSDFPLVRVLRKYRKIFEPLLK